MKIISRTEALAAGLKHYFTGKPCRRGHVALRLVSICACVECKLESYRDYYAANPEKMRDSVNRRRKANIETVRARAREKYAANPELGRERNRAKYAANAEAMRERTRRYFKANPEKNIAQAHRRRAAEMNRTPKWVDREFETFVTEEAALLCKMRESTCGGKWSIDHMLPLRGKTVSGLHIATNLQVIPFILNSRKQNAVRFTKPGEWLEGACK